MSAPAAQQLRHDALLYASEREFTDALVPFVRAGLDGGEAVVAVTTTANIALLRQALGVSASRVDFVDAAEWYRHAPRTIAGYRGNLDERLAAGAHAVRVIGEVQFGETEEQHRDWVRYEAALNHVFAASPAWIVCPYDLRALPAPVLRHAPETHPHILHGGERVPSAAYRDPRDLLLQLLSGPATPEGEPLAEVAVGEQLGPSLEALRASATHSGMHPHAVDELESAVNEVLTNALVHGRAPIYLRVYRTGDWLVCEVRDAGGRFTDPLAGYMPPTDTDRGAGLWVARQLCDRVELLVTDGATVVRLTRRLR